VPVARITKIAREVQKQRKNCKLPNWYKKQTSKAKQKLGKQGKLLL